MLNAMVILPGLAALELLELLGLLELLHAASRPADATASKATPRRTAAGFAGGE
jgi:hypothetical protein